MDGIDRRVFQRLVDVRGKYAFLAAPACKSPARMFQCVWGRDGKRETLHLVFPANEVKNDTDLEFRLPPGVITILKVYLAEARPLLANLGNDYLFPGEGQRHKGSGLLSKQIARTMLRAVGVRATGHQFRHLVGYIYLLDNPGGHEVVRRFLGHKSIETTIRFYAGMEQETAIKHLDQVLEARRQRLVRRPSTQKNLSPPNSREK
jgi:integrase